MDWSKFKCGDVVRWKAFTQDFEFHYGLIIGLEDDYEENLEIDLVGHNED